MSYCRFRNTLSDLKDCFNNLPDENLSREEAEAFAELILLVNDISEQYENYDDFNDLKNLALYNQEK